MKTGILIDRFINFLFPHKCLNCDTLQFNTGLCSSCWQGITFLDSNCCKICGISLAAINDDNLICGNCIIEKPSYNKAISVMKYDNNSSSLIYKFKYADKLHYSNYFACWMDRVAKKLLNQADIITPVPIHKLRLLKRKYNQSAIIAKKISLINSKQFIPDLLLKKVNNKPQVGLSNKERKRNVKNVYEFNKNYSKYVENKNILLIDDVITTGSTIEACCKKLKSQKINKIFVLTLARVCR